MREQRALKITVPTVGRVSAIFERPDAAQAVVVLGHGTGSDMAYPVISGLAAELVAAGLAVLRFHYPYSDQPDYVAQSGMITDPTDVLIATMRAVTTHAAVIAPDLTIYAGGHSMSAEVASLADAEQALEARALIFLGYPVMGQDVTHLSATRAPVLIVQGRRDHLGSEAEINSMARHLGAGATVRWIDGGSHRFEIDGRDQREVLAMVAGHIRDYVVATL